MREQNGTTGVIGRLSALKTFRQKGSESDGKREDRPHKKKTSLPPLSTAAVGPSDVLLVLFLLFISNMLPLF